MAVIDAENLQLGPLVGGYARCLLRWLNHVKYDRYPVFISFPDNAYVRICGEGLDSSERL